MIDGKSQKSALITDWGKIPTQNRHGAAMLDEDMMLIDIFSPIREEFLNKQNC